MSITKEQWAEVERQLSGLFGWVELLCDGYTVNAEVKNIALLRQGVVVYVNGWVRGEWTNGQAEEARKFYRETKRYLYSAKTRNEARLKMKNRRLPSELRDWYSRIEAASVSTWAPWWTSPKTFARHLRKTCTDISVVKIGY